MKLSRYLPFAPVLFLAGAWFTYPALWIGGSCFADFRLFGHASLALAALLLLALDPERLRRFFLPMRPPVMQVIGAAVPGCVAILLHYYHNQGDPVAFLNAIFYLVVPLAAAVWADEFRKPFLLYIVLLGAANLIFLLLQRINGIPGYGVTGNWNWSATVMILAGAAFAMLFRPKEWPFGALCGMLLTLIGGLAFYSRGATAAMLVAIPASLALLSRIRALRIGGLCLVIGGTLMMLAACYTDTDRTRRDLATAAATLFREHPLIGIGIDRFESESPAALPETYFDNRYTAERHPHPHNEFYRFAAELGIGGIALCGAVILILYGAIRRYVADGDDIYEPAFLLFAVLLPLLHGQVDVLLAEWPVDTILLIALGLNWHAAAGENEAADRPESEISTVRWPLYAVQIILAGFLLSLLIRTGLSGWYARQATLAARHGQDAGMLWETSRRWFVTPHNLYAGAAIALYDRKDPQTAIALLRRLETETPMQNYLHNQGMMARALAASGDLDAAIPRFEAELKNFPRDEATRRLLAATKAERDRLRNNRK